MNKCGSRTLCCKLLRVIELSKPLRNGYNAKSVTQNGG